MTNQYIGVAQSTFQVSKDIPPISPLGFGRWTPAWLAFTIEKCSVFLATRMDYENYVYAEKGHFDFQGDQICHKKDVEIQGHPKCWVFDHESSPPAIYRNRTRDWQEHHRNHSVLNQEQICSYLPSGTNISPSKELLKLIFLFQKWDMLDPRRVINCGSEQGRAIHCANSRLHPRS